MRGIVDGSRDIVSGQNETVWESREIVDASRGIVSASRDSVGALWDVVDGSRATVDALRTIVSASRQIVDDARMSVRRRREIVGAFRQTAESQSVDGLSFLLARRFSGHFISVFSSTSKIDPAPTIQPGEPVIAFLLLAQQQFPVGTAVEKLRALPFAAYMTAPTGDGDGTVAFSIGDETVGILSVPMPYPENLEVVYAASWMFPDVATALGGHEGFVTVALTGGAGEPAQRRALLTRIVAALASEPGVLGVYWPDAAAIIRPDVFIQMAKRILKDDSFPLYLWVNMTVWQNEDSTHSLATTGMSKFGRYEIEVINVKVSPSGLREYIYGVAHTIILDNPPVKDGMEVGRFGSSVLRAYLRPSVWEGRGTVIRLNT